MKKIVQNILFLVVLVSGFTFTGNAQRIKATASLDTAQILLGDQIKLFLKLDKPTDVSVKFPVINDTISEFIEVINRSGIDTFTTDNNEIETLIQTYYITSFDSGSYRIPNYWFSFNVGDIKDSVASNSLMLHVYNMQIDTTKGPTDIKMPYDAPLTLKEVLPYILGVILIAAILFFILYSIKRKKANKPIFAKPLKPKEPAHIVALRELDRISQEKLWQQEKYKAYYSEVTEALRVYIEDRFDIRAMEQTSDETIEAFRVRKELLNEKHFSNLSQILSIADMVKFAKYKPLPDDNNFTLVNAYFFVNETKKEEKINTPQKPENDQEGEEVVLK